MRTSNTSPVLSRLKCVGEWGDEFYKDDPLGWFKLFDVIPQFLGKYIGTSGPGRGECVTVFQSDLEVIHRMTSELLLMRYKTYCPFRDEESEVLAAHKIIIDKRLGSIKYSLFQ